MSSFGRNLKLDHNLPLTLPILNIRGVGKAEQKKKRKKKRENENIYIIKEQIYEKFNFFGTFEFRHFALWIIFAWDLNGA